MDRRNRKRSLRGARFLILGLVCHLFLGPVSPGLAQDVPETTQLPILLKLLTYDRTLWEKPEPRLKIGVLVHSADKKSVANHDAMLAAMNDASGITVNHVQYDFSTLIWKNVEDLKPMIAGSDIDVLYITMGHEQLLDQITQATRELDILSMTGTPGFVKVGLSVGIELQDERPRLLVNLQALNLEGHQLDSRVLRLCTVVNP